MVGKLRLESMQFIIQVQVLFHNDVAPYGGRKRLAARVDIGSSYAFVDDEVNCTTLSQQNAYASVGHYRARENEADTIDPQDGIRKTDFPINLFSYTGVGPVGIMSWMCKILSEFWRDNISLDTIGPCASVFQIILTALKFSSGSWISPSIPVKRTASVTVVMLIPQYWHGF